MPPVPALQDAAGGKVDGMSSVRARGLAARVPVPVVPTTPMTPIRDNESEMSVAGSSVTGASWSRVSLSEKRTPPEKTIEEELDELVDEHTQKAEKRHRSLSRQVAELRASASSSSNLAITDVPTAMNPADVIAKQASEMVGAQLGLNQARQASGYSKRLSTVSGRV